MKKVLAMLLAATMMASTCMVSVSAAANDNTAQSGAAADAVMVQASAGDTAEAGAETDSGSVHWDVLSTKYALDPDNNYINKNYIAYNSDGSTYETSGYLLSEVEITITGQNGLTDIVVAPTYSKAQLIAGYQSQVSSVKTDSEKYSLMTKINELQAVYPDYVTTTAISGSAFSGDTKVQSILFPNTLKEIGDGAFSGCTALCTSDAATIKTQGVTGLAPITIPESCYKIGSSAFQSCTAVRKFEVNGSGSIGSNAFAYCNGLQSVKLSDKIQTIDSNAFDSCIGLTQMTLPSDLGALAGTTQGFLGSSVFNNCTALTDVVFNGLKLNTLPSGVFYGCTALRKCTIPASVTAIEDSAFYGCNAISTVTIDGNVSKIGSNVFYNCNSLVSVNLPQSVTTIGDSTFYNCKNLAEISIPDKATTLGTSLFYGCTKLKKAYVGDEVRKVPDYSFAECSNLSEVTLGSKLTTIGTNAFNNCVSLVNIAIPDAVTKIESGAFYGCNKLKSIAYSSELAYLGSSAFAECTSLETITPNSKLSIIGSGAFSNCGKLTTMLLPTSITSIEDASAFYGCKNLKLIGYDIADAGFSYVCKWLQDNAYYIDYMSGDEHTYWAGYALLHPEKIKAAKPYGDKANVDVTFYCDDTVFPGDIKFIYNDTATKALKSSTEKTYIFKDKNLFAFDLAVDDSNTSSFSVHFPQELICNTVGSAMNADNIVVYKEVSGKLYPVKCNVWVSDYGVNIDNITGGTYYIGEKPETVDLTSIALSFDSAKDQPTGTIFASTDVQINAQYTPANTTIERNLSWSVKSYTEGCTATISDEGVLNIKGEGKVMVTAQAANGVETTVAVKAVQDPNRILGDVTGDKKVTVADAVAIQKSLAKMTTLTDVQKKAADVTGDGKVTVADAVKIQKFVAKMIPSL